MLFVIINSIKHNDIIGNLHEKFQLLKVFYYQFSLRKFPTSEYLKCWRRKLFLK